MRRSDWGGGGALERSHIDYEPMTYLHATLIYVGHTYIGVAKKGTVTVPLLYMDILARGVRHPILRRPHYQGTNQV